MLEAQALHRVVELDIVKPTMKKEELLDNLKFSASKATIALLPGSRQGEIKKILPVMPLFTMSFLRPTTKRNPSSSKYPRSPV